MSTVFVILNGLDSTAVFQLPLVLMDVMGRVLAILRHFPQFVTVKPDGQEPAVLFK